MDLLTPEEMAEKLRMSRRSLLRYVRLGIIPKTAYVRIGKKYRFIEDLVVVALKEVKNGDGAGASLLERQGEILKKGDEGVGAQNAKKRRKGGVG